MKKYGLIGTPLSHSFSKKFFTDKFESEGSTNCSYDLFDIDNIEDLTSVLSKNPMLFGLNVTIPYKEAIFPYLNEIDPIAKEIGAVNTIKIDSKKGVLKGFNTDYFGFKKSLKPFINNAHQRALIIGTGGAAKAVHYALKELNIDCLFVSRNPLSENHISYNDINDYVMKYHQVIINTSPIGMFPEANNKPDLPYHFLTSHHLLYDLVYNPEKTQFLNEGLKHNCIQINGLQMLILQAEKSWEIWNS